MGVRRNFSRVGNVDILFILFSLLTMQCKWTLTKRFASFYTIKKEPHVTAAVTKMRFLAAIARNESRKDFFQRGTNQSRISRPPYPQLRGTLSQGSKFQYRRHGVAFVGLAPQTKLQPPD